MKFLQMFPGEMFTAKEIAILCDLNKSVYPNLTKLINDNLSGIKYSIRVTKDSRRKKEFVYYYKVEVKK